MKMIAMPSDRIRRMRSKSASVSVRVNDGSGLVENDHLAFTDKRLGNRDHLLLRYA